MPKTLATQAIRQSAIEFITNRLFAEGFKPRVAPPGFLADLGVSHNSRSHLVKVLASAAPHARGGRGSLGLHWMLGETAGDFVGLVDLSRQLAWLLPVEEFQRRAKAVSGGRYHLDWIVMPIGRHHSLVPMEGAFDEFRLLN